ncbi:DUF7519 family protein [Natrinema halophilum]|uniref:Uncharacterized protein n=1 Tax=Natrinema halophilum TaxID=1699371 RepID=A0A7D5KSI4_9EURY|nr:hypothetical protein [Natrinema halophilum]QLG49484.1 hypothetical protein HYG82_11735 [Natrinema halophilum]
MRGDAVTGSAGRTNRRGRDGNDSVAGGAVSRRAVARETGRYVLESAIRGVRTALRRPTASDVAMICWTLGVGIAIGSTLVGRRLAVLATGAGLAAALTTVLLASERPLLRGLGGVVAAPVSVLVSSPLLLASVLALTSSGVGLIAGVTVWALVVAAFAAGLLSWPRFGRGGVRHGSTGTILAALGVVAVAVLPILPRADLRAHAVAAATDTLGVIEDVLVTPTGMLAVVSFAGLVAVAAMLSSRALATLPFERLVPPDRRDAVTTAVSGLRRGCSLSIRGALALGAGAVIAPIAVDRLDGPVVTPVALRTELPAPAGDALASLVVIAGVRLALVALAGIAFALLFLEWSRRILGRGPAVVVARLVAPMIGGALVAIVLVQATADSALAADIEGFLRATLEGPAPPSVLEFLTSIPPFTLVAIVLVFALVALSSLLWTVTTLRVIRLLPERAIGAALAAGAVFVLAVALAIVGRVEPAIWTTAAAFVLWDIGEYSDVIRTELGRGASTMRAELVHVGGTLLSGGVVAGGTVALYRWRAGIPMITDPVIAAVAVGSGLFVVVLVAWALRG